MLRNLPRLFADVFLNCNRKRMYRMHLGRCRKKYSFFFAYTFNSSDEGNLRYTNSQSACLIKNKRVCLRQSLYIVSALYQDSLFRCGCNSGRNRRSRRKLQAAGEINKEKIQYTLPVTGCSVYNNSPQQRYRHQKVSHLVSKVLYRRALCLRFFYEVNNMRKRRILSDLFDKNRKLSRFHDTSCVYP